MISIVLLIFLLLLFILSISIIIYYIYKTSKKNWTIFNAAQSYIEEKISSIKTVEDCDNLLAYIKEYHDQIELSEFKMRYSRYYYFVQGIKYIINKNNTE